MSGQTACSEIMSVRLSEIMSVRLSEIMSVRLSQIMSGQTACRTVRDNEWSYYMSDWQR